MKTLSVQMFNKIRLCGIAASFAFMPMSMKSATNVLSLNQDTYVHTLNDSIPPSGTQNINVLKNAPSPTFKLMNENKQAVIVVDLSKNILYKYDDNGCATDAYLICSGKPSTPTHTGINCISHVETYPYKSAPAYTKRRRSPRDYGPKIICLKKVDIKTGQQEDIGEYIHGNNNSDSIGKYYSHGCVRMDNDAIKKLSEEVRSGQYVMIIK